VEVFTRKLDSKIAKQDGKKTSRVSVPKLIDAKFAGTSKSQQTTLILAEGDSALAMLLKGVDDDDDDDNDLSHLC
jgi:DNA gyrase/topoisomerase IV subunit B